MTTKVEQRSDALTELSSEWNMLTALMRGTKAMRAAGKAYLPMWAKEDKDSYTTRLNTSVLHPVFKRTVGVMSAKPFVKDIGFSPNLPDGLDIFSEDVDLYGTSINEYFADRFKECVSHGLTGVLVEYSGKGYKTKAEEKAANARPYLCTYPCDSILGFKSKSGNLTQIRLMEHVHEDDGAFGEKIIQQVRVLEVGAWATYRKDEKLNEFVLYENGLTGLDVVPFVFMYGEKFGFGLGMTPLIDLAYQNIEHWQSSSDQRTIEHFARVPVLFTKMIDDDKIVIGSGVAIASNDEKADVRWVEHGGNAIGAGVASIEALENRMRQAGSELLIRRAGNITATQIKSENEANRSTLQNIVVEFEEAVETCLHYAAKWIGIDYHPEVEIHKEFNTADDELSADILLRAENQKIITKSDAHNELKRRNIISSSAEYVEHTESQAA